MTHGPRAAFARYAPLTDEAWAAAEPCFVRRSLAPGAHLLRPGERAELVAYVERGVLREYYPNRAGVERNKAFVLPGEIGGSLADLLSSKPSQAGVQALPRSELWVIRYAELQRLAGAHPGWAAVARGAAERLAASKAVRERQLLTMTAEERYQALLADRPALAERVAQHHLASFLGITPEALSRIRKRMAVALR